MKSAKQIAVLVALAALAGSSAAAFAFQPLVTDDTGTQGSGGNQLELALNFDRANSAGNVARLHALPLVYTRGLTETLDVFAGLSYARIQSSTDGRDAGGSTNPSFGAKWRFFENQAGNTSFALKPEILLPVGAGRESAGLGRGKTSGNLTLILTQEVPFGAIHINAGVGRDRYRDPSNNPDATRTRASLAPVWNLTRQWKLALDLGTETAHTQSVRVRSNFLELGAIYLPSKDFDFALGILRSSDNDSPGTTAYTATAGITWRFE